VVHIWPVVLNGQTDGYYKSLDLEVRMCYIMFSCACEGDGHVMSPHCCEYHSICKI